MEVRFAATTKTPMGRLVEAVKQMRDKSYVRELLATAVARTTARIYYEWRKRIDERANREHWGRHYSASMNIKRLGDLSMRITAEGLFVGLVEDGVRSWDMKKKLVSPANPVRRIAFRHFTPQVTTRTSGVMPQSIYDAAKKLRGRRALTEIDGKTIEMTAAEKAKGYTASIYYGMRKLGAVGHSQYMTFRTITFFPPKDPKKRGSWQSKWIYPSVPASPIFPWVEENADRWALQELIKIMNESGGDEAADTIIGSVTGS